MVVSEDQHDRPRCLVHSESQYFLLLASSWRKRTNPDMQGGLSLRLKCTWFMVRIRQQDLAASTKSAVRLSAMFAWRRLGVTSIEQSRRSVLPHHTCVEVQTQSHNALFCTPYDLEGQVSIEPHQCYSQELRYIFRAY